MSKENLAIAKLWLEAFADKNLDNLLSLYSDSAEHYSPKLKKARPETDGKIIGRAAMHAWWKDAFERLPSLRYEATSLTANSERVFMEYTRKLSGEEDILVAEVLEIRAGKIIKSRVYHG